MEKPFTFGQIAKGNNFINRRSELKKLSNGIRSGIHHVLISPRRWGKSSLIEKLSNDPSLKKDFIFCKLDLFAIRSEEQFYYSLSQTLMNCTHQRVKDLIHTVGKLFRRIIPKISLSADPNSHVEFSFELAELKKHPEEILNLPENLAKLKKKKLVICIDEFQNLEFFEESLAFQKLLRSCWQRHENVIYILYGSKRHMISQLFTHRSMPFYKFGQIMFLEKIQTEDYIPYITNGFNRYEKKIEDKTVLKIVECMENHPSGVQQLALQIWQNTTNSVTDSVWNLSLNEFFANNYTLFQRDFDSLSNLQVKLLKALVFESDSQLTSKDIISRYDLGSSASVIRSLEALENKEVIDRFSGKIEFVDPGFRLWLKERIFN